MTFYNFLQTWLMLSEILVIQSAPKIGHPLFDPLSFEANEDGKTNNLRSPQDKIVPLERSSQNSKESQVNKKPCQNYDFNDSQCKSVSNRLLCGYNKNIGVNKNDEIIDLGNGCRTRGDRVECGYVTGPFNNPRRPPVDLINTPLSKRLANVTESSLVRLKLNPLKTILLSITKPVQTHVAVVTKQTKSISLASTAYITSTKLTSRTPSSTKPTTKSTILTTTIKGITGSTTSTLSTTTPLTTSSSSQSTYTFRKRVESKCIEKGDRIVCYDVKPN